jgi:hypothetical protein
MSIENAGDRAIDLDSRGSRPGSFVQDPALMCVDSVGEIQKYEITPEGFLRAKVNVSRLGIAEYSGGIFKAKLAEELFSPKTIDSMRGIPVTDEHPTNSNGIVFVGSDNVSSLSKGDFSEPEIDGDTIRGTIVIRDKDMVSDVMGGKRGVSLGYYKKDDPTPGEIDGQKYDIIQRNIYANHLAITDSPRLGDSVSIELDSSQININEEIKMGKKFLLEVDGKIASDRGTKTYRTTNGDDIQVDSDIYEELAALKNIAEDHKKEADSLDTKKKELEKQISSLEGDSNPDKVKLEAEKAKTASLTKELDSLKGGMDAKVREAADELLVISEKAKLFDVDSKGKNAEQIKKEVISKSSLDVDGMSLDSARVDAYYDAACSLFVKEEEIKVEETNIEGDSSDDDRLKQMRDAGVDC